MKNKTTIGRLDKIDLPEFGIENAIAKIDTGAFTSSVNCKKITLKEDTLSFLISLKVEGKAIRQKFQTKQFKQKLIKSSNGINELRYVIKTKVRLFGHVFPAEFSLSDRSKMKNPILIGRKLLKNRYIVDVSKKNLSFDHKMTLK
ncbi:MAG: hypothetical protein ACJA2C_001143 [Marinoscillum sp.]|jgi:hypothetical protein